MPGMPHMSNMAAPSTLGAVSFENSCKPRVPAREMLAEMLLLSGKFADALHEYQASLASDPNRFNALLGAGRAAEGLGDTKIATGYYSNLLANCVDANGKARIELEHARAVVRKGGYLTALGTQERYFLPGSRARVSVPKN
jgi:tetratricopeptide (TPR) repeat protein